MDASAGVGSDTRHMTLTRHILGAAAAAAALTLAACGGDDGATSASTAPATTSGRTGTIGVADSGLGRILVDSHRRTLYLFERDAGDKSACFGACAASWPPLRATGKPTVGSGADDSLVATTRRSDGRPEVTYNGHPVYLFTGDSGPGDTNGQGVNAFGGIWSVLSPAGAEIASSGAGSGY